MPNIESFELQEEFLIVSATARAGVFDVLKNKSITLEKLKTKTGCEQRALWTVVEALVALNYLEYEGEKIKLTEEASSVFYDQKNPRYIGFSFMHTYNLISSWLNLPEILKPEKLSTEDEDFEKEKNYISAMSFYPKKEALEIADFCLKGLSQNPEVLDIGGGPLTYARAFTQKGAVVTIFDLPEVINMTKSELASDLPIRMVEGDFTIGLTVEGTFDLVYLGNVCHIYGEKENRKLFKDAAEKLKKGGRIIINDFIRGTGPGAAVFAVNMLVNTDSGGTWTFEQYKTWLQDAGFSVSPFREVGGSQLITAVKQT